MEGDGCTLEVIWSEYVSGGVGRWAWFMAWAASRIGGVAGKDENETQVKTAQFFHDQLAAFLHDHVPNPADAPLPRV